MSLLNNYLYVYIYVIVLREGVYKNLNVFPLYNCTVHPVHLLQQKIQCNNNLYGPYLIVLMPSQS